VPAPSSSEIAMYFRYLRESLRPLAAQQQAPDGAFDPAGIAGFPRHLRLH
jgi:hypothetical protein